MSSYFKRFLWRYSTPISLVIGVASAGIFFWAPLKLIFIDSQKEEYINGIKKSLKIYFYVHLEFYVYLNIDPINIKRREDAEKRKELIKNKHKEYKECKDPEQKKILFKELSSIHQQRYVEAQRQAHLPLYTKRD
jgi:hypothetical protein